MLRIVVILVVAGTGCLRVGETDDSPTTTSNKPPTAEIESHDDDQEVPAGSIVLSGTVSDPDDDELTVRWTANDQRICADAAPESDGTTTCTAQLEAGAATITLLAEDSAGAEGTHSISLTLVAPDPPIVAIESVASTAADALLYSNVPLSLQGSALDALGDHSNLEVWWSVDGATVEANPTVPDAVGVTVGSLVVAQGAHTLTLHARDARGLSGSDNQPITIGAANMAPEVSWVSPSADGASALGEVIELIVNADDAESDVAALAVTFFDGSTSLATVSPDATGVASWTTTTLGVGEHSLSAEVVDTEGFSSGPITRTWEVSERPTIEILAPADQQLFASDASVELEVRVSDPEDDEDTLALSWTVDGQVRDLVADSDGMATDAVSGLIPGVYQDTSVTVTDSAGLSATALVSFTVNTPPTVDTVEITPEHPGYGDTATCSATTTPPGVPIAYTWTVEGIVLGTGETLELIGGVEPGDEVQCTATATDVVGDSDAETTAVTVSNEAPQITRLEIDPGTPVRSTDTLTCDGDALDPEGFGVGLTYHWTGPNVDATGATLVLDPVDTQPGDEITCTATATDAQGATASDSSMVLVINSSPVVAEVSIDPTSDVTTSSTLTCTATASDSDLDPGLSVAFLWTIDGDGITIGTDPSVTLDPDFVDQDDIVRCTVTATDSLDASASASATVGIGNRAPSINAVTITGDPLTGASVSCVASAADDDGDAVMFTYTWRDDQDIELGTGPSFELSPAHALSPTDELTCHVVADDAHGGQDADSAAVTVENTAPTIDQVAVLPSGDIGTSTTVACGAQGSDVDPGDAVVLSFVWTDAGGLELATSASFALEPADVQPNDTLTCTVTASDGFGGVANDSVDLVLANADPTISNAQITPPILTIGDQPACTATAADPDLGAPTLTYLWSNLTQTTDLGANPTLSPSNAAPGDTLQCTATATDAHGGTASTEVTAPVRNRNPTVPNVTITPATGVTTSSVVECTATSADPDGFGLSWSYAWTNTSAGVPLGTDATLALDPADVHPFDEVTCEAIATDDHGGSRSGIDTVAIGNTDPVVADVTITGALTTTSEVTCSATVTDPDGGTPTVDVSWWNQTTQTLIGTDNPLTLTPADISSGQALQCFLTATDSDGGATSGIAAVTLGNIPPVLNSVTIDPSAGVTTSSTLTCAAAASDPDSASDPVLTYAWTNQSQGGTTLGTTDTVELSNLIVSPGDVVVCTASADDGTDIVTDSAQVTVENTEPDVSNVTITAPGELTATSEVTCSATVSDADGDTPGVTVAWFNHTTGASLGSDNPLILTPSVVSSGETVQCEVTATDAHNGTANGSTTRTLGNIPPSVDTLTITPSGGPVMTSSELTCAATASDEDSASAPAITYAWTNQSQGGTTLGTTDTVELSNLIVSPGDVVVCTASADDGTDIVTDSAQVTVENTEPDVSNVTITAPGELTATSEVTCSATVSDADGDTPGVTVAWFNHTTGASLGSDNPLILTPSVVSSGETVQCEVTATDAHNGTANGSTTRTLGNIPPSVDTLTITPSGGPVMTSSELTCAATASDEDSASAPAITYAWTNQTDGDALLGTGTVVVLDNVSTSPGDVVACTATADDGSDTHTATGTVTVGNTDPVVDTVSLSPDPVANDADVTCTATASDGDGAIGLVISTAIVNETTGAALGTGPTVTLSAAVASPGDILRCDATAMDPHSGTGTSSSTATVDDRAPDVSVVITPDPVHVGDTATCEVTASDPDGQAIESIVYSWTNVTDGFRSLGTAETLEISDASVAARGQEIQCAVTVSATAGPATGDYAQATLGNAPPSQPMVSISPDPATELDDLHCSIDLDGVDPDGDAVTYTFAWYVDGVASGDTTQVLPSEATALDETWTCEATPSDGTESGTFGEGAVGPIGRSTFVDMMAGNISMIAVYSGTFEMGQTAGQVTCGAQPCDGDSFPAHQVTLTHDYWLGQTEITQAQWSTLIDEDPSAHTACGSDCPVDSTTWWDTAAFANALSLSEYLPVCYTLIGCSGDPGVDLDCTDVVVNSPTGSPYDCAGYRLPTEAEWEYAARADTDLTYAGSDTVSDVAWGSANSGGVTHPVAQLAANGWGFHDQTGNVWEWVWDWQEDYTATPVVDPEGPATGTVRIHRGGGPASGGGHGNVADRNRDVDDVAWDARGFRIARSAPQDTDSDDYTNDVDCDDDNDAVHPDAPETDGDDVDSNCDGWDGAFCELEVTDIDDLVGYWSLDGDFEVDGGIAFSSNDELIGNPSPVNGIVGSPPGAMAFDGVDDEAKLWKGRSFRFSDAFTVMTWFRTPSSNHGTIAETITGEVQHDQGWHLTRESGDTVAFGVGWSAGGHVEIFADFPPDDQWHHIAGVRDGDELTLFIDGVRGATESFPAIPAGVDAGNQINVGHTHHFYDYPGPYKLLEGAVDELILVDRALETADIEAYVSATWPDECRFFTHIDGDGDGYRGVDDCDDKNPAVNPGVPETEGDDIDANCDGVDDPTVISLSSGYEMVSIPSATFTMGCTAEQEPDCYDPNEYPDHDVTLTRDFLIGRTEVTQAQWSAIIGNGPSADPACGADCPVENVSWWDAAAFANALSTADGFEACYSFTNCTGAAGVDLDCTTGSVGPIGATVFDCDGYRLPTEAEWERAARADDGTKYAGSDTLDTVAWYDQNSDDQIHPVSQLGPNGFGLFDMSGNVREWCWDREDISFYETSPTEDPTGPTSGTIRIYRGGGFDWIDTTHRVAYRNGAGEDTATASLGFRLVRTFGD